MGAPQSTATRATSANWSSRAPRCRVILLCAAYTAYCLVVVARYRSLEIERDSVRYLESGVLDPRQPGILPVAMISSLGDAQWLAIVQILLASCAWSLLALGVFELVRGRLGAGLAAAVLLYSLTTQLMSWHWLALADGLAITVCVTWVGSLLLYLASKRTEASLWALLIAPTALIALTRPTLLILVAPVQLVALLRVAPPASRIGAAARWSALLGAVGWGLLRLLLLNSVRDYRRFYAENNLFDKPGYRAWAEPHLDGCADHLATIDRRPSLERCADASEWLTSAAGSVWRWVLDEPVQATSEFVSFLMATRFRAYGTQLGPLPFDLSELIVPRSSSVVRVCLLFLAVGLGLVAAVGNATRPSRTALSIAIAAALGALGYLAVAWVADGMEHERHMMPVTVLAPLMLLLAPTVMTVRRSGRRPGPLRRCLDPARRLVSARSAVDPSER